jgi:hypothetical protein
MATRQEVYNVIDGERDYQDAQRPDRFTESVLPVSGELLCIRTYLGYADNSYTNNPGEAPIETLEHIRKIAAMCVRAMEHHGAPPRTKTTKSSQRSVSIGGSVDNSIINTGNNNTIFDDLFKRR